MVVSWRECCMLVPKVWSMKSSKASQVTPTIMTKMKTKNGVQRLGTRMLLEYVSTTIRSCENGKAY